MIQYIILGIAVVLIIGAIVYIIKQKKSGVKCIGCPYSKGNTCCKGSCNVNDNLK